MRMANTINDAIKSVRARKRKLEAELRLLAKAEKALSRIVNADGDSSPEAKVIGVFPAVSISEAVRSALRDLGEAESNDVIEHVRKKYLPDANENTIRSLLSVWAMKKRVIRNGKKYSLPQETPNEPAPT
jgi:hypothetical protein